MGIEIERKFLVTGDRWRTLGGVAKTYRQGYLCSGEGRTVRVRIAEDRAFLTIKGPPSGLARAEFEYPIPVADAGELLQLCLWPPVEKVRHRIAIADLVWEVDDFLGANQGLVLAEVELVAEHQAIALPDWVGLEVSGDRRYTNAYLAQHPFQTWP